MSKDINFSKAPEGCGGNIEIRMIASSSSNIIINAGKENEKRVPSEFSDGRFYKVNEKTLARIKKQCMPVKEFLKYQNKSMTSRD